jgi:hypothetical protein
MWLVIINPIAKLALTLAPVAMAVEVRARQLDGTESSASVFVTVVQSILID